MKKLISLLMCVCMLLAGLGAAFAEAEDFELRSGIHFGDTIDDIVEKETTLTRLNEESNEFQGRISGYDDASCMFTFDDDGKLEDMRYIFGSDVCYSRDKMNNVYLDLYRGLVRKYGTAIGNTGGSCELITGSAIDTMTLYVYLLGELDGYSSDYTDYDEWIVDTKGGHVKIDLVSFYLRNSDFEYSYYVDLSYKFYTDEDFKAAQQEKQAARDEVDNDL